MGYHKEHCNHPNKSLLHLFQSFFSPLSMCRRYKLVTWNTFQISATPNTTVNFWAGAENKPCTSHCRAEKENNYILTDHNLLVYLEDQGFLRSTPSHQHQLLLSMCVRDLTSFKHHFFVFMTELQLNKVTHWIITLPQDKNSAG